MPGPEQLIRAVTLPVTVGLGIARRLYGVVEGFLPGGDDTDRPEPETADLDIAIATDDAMTRERDPVEEAPLLPDDDLEGHVDVETAVVAQAADEGATEPPGPEVHVDDRLT